MIIRKDLEPGVQFRIKNGSHLTPQHIMQLIKEKADEYGIAIGFREDFTSDSVLEGWLGLLKAPCLALYMPDYGVKATHYVLYISTEGTYLFLNLQKHMFCPSSHWSTIVMDIFEELFT